MNWLVDRLLQVNPDGVEAFGRALATPVRWLVWLLTVPPPWVIGVAILLLGWRLGRSFPFGLAMGALVAGLWLLGLWSDAMRSAALVTVAVVAAVAIGLPLGIAGARYRRFGQAARVVYDLMQTVPSFVYLIPAAMLLGLGTAPALLATVVVAVPPVARLTDLGLRSVRVEERDAALALGLSDRLMLLLVELPLARPSIMAGVNQAVMGALGMVVIASMIGARGLGETVLIGLQRADAGQGAVGGLGIVLLAILVDRLTQAAGRPHWITAAKPREG
ncbi:MAG: ABC transporter permease subunit [Alphaproteobacteria bacterium]|nr:ABC transporter permease subunit [Alphaproteobacteria bacterium]